MSSTANMMRPVPSRFTGSVRLGGGRRRRVELGQLVAGRGRPGSAAWRCRRGHRRALRRGPPTVPRPSPRPPASRPSATKNAIAGFPGRRRRSQRCPLAESSRCQRSRCHAARDCGLRHETCCLRERPIAPDERRTPRPRGGSPADARVPPTVNRSCHPVGAAARPVGDRRAGRAGQETHLHHGTWGRRGRVDDPRAPGADGRDDLTAVRLMQFYLHRIEKLDLMLNAVITVQPRRPSPTRGRPTRPAA